MSLQAKRPESRGQWKGRVKAASTSAIPQPHFASGDRMSITLYYLPKEPMQGDVDNIVKPVLDALSRHIFINDRQVERVLVQKFEPGNVFGFAQPSETFAEALDGEKPVLYVRVSDDPFEDLV